jgi:acetyltransferase-like isoleucine patch superfamily enzyme
MIENTISKEVVIEDDVWLGYNVIVLPGVTIGKGSVIGAGSVVSKDIPPYSIAIGNPARVIKKREIK